MHNVDLSPRGDGKSSFAMSQHLAKEKALVFDTMLKKSNIDLKPSQSRSMLIIDDPQDDICDHDLDMLRRIDDILVGVARCLKVPTYLLKGEPGRGTENSFSAGNHHHSNRPCAPVDLSQTPLAGPDRWHAKGDAKND